MQGDSYTYASRADQAAVLVDAAPYFAAVAEAIAGARRRVMIVGWDVHSGIALRRPTEPTANTATTTLAEVIRTAVAENPALEIYLLVWDYALLYAFEREPLPLLRARVGHERVHVAAAADHPVGGSHHQKLVVVDEQLAFAGGIDLARARWDRPSHLADDPARVGPGGRAHGPFHDLQLALTGPVAGVLAEVARDRWRSATGETLSPLSPDEAAPFTPSPSQALMTFEDVPAAVALTRARWGESDACRDVERLYRQQIAAAKQLIYIENQYLTAPTIADALADRLRDEAGPQVIIVTPEVQSGPLEQRTLGAVRRDWLAQLEEADAHDRLRVICPIAAGEPVEPVNVHAKMMCCDDVLLRVGSANLTNRSMRLDSECDVTLTPRRPADRDRIGGLWRQLLAHHFGVTPDALPADQAATEVVDTLIAETARARRLRSRDCPAEPLLAHDIVDPEEPLDTVFARTAIPAELRARERPRVALLVAGLVLLVATIVWAVLAGDAVLAALTAASRFRS